MTEEAKLIFSAEAIDRGRLCSMSICVFVDRGTDAGWVLVDASGFVGFLNQDFGTPRFRKASIGERMKLPNLVSPEIFPVPLVSLQVGAVGS